MDLQDLDPSPGFRRRVVVAVREDAVAAMLEDDIHCLSVTLRHDGQRVTAVEPVFDRAPWTTCPGAMAKLVATFEGLPLAEVTARRDKKQNCTHLHDMAVMAAAHYADAAVPSEFVYDVAVSDAVGGLRHVRLWRNGELVHHWTEQDGTFVAPEAIAGQSLMTLRDWIGSLTGMEQEAARLLQWCGLIAHGRSMPLDVMNDATALPANCYTLQPERAVEARPNAVRIDFWDGGRAPLADLRPDILARL